ncbi:hypothetical protein GGS26DRAFT_507299 [Hypomontagnella submonticulosa]|nr:hypothetical protein GGS26DRAFT_507299 [Hypomontagnella submonticulosa]
MPIKSFVKRFGKGAATKQVYIYETWLRWIARGLQFIFAIIVCGIYGNRVDRDRKDGNSQSVAWVYALLVAGLTCITCLLYSIPNPFSRMQSHRLFAWDLILFVLWIVQFGIFAGLFLKREEDEYEGVSVALMKCGVWIDLVNAVFWLGTGLYGCFRTFVGRKVNDKIDQVQNKVENQVNSKVSQFAGSAANNFSFKMNPLKKETV